MSYKVTNSFRENPNIYRLYDLENSSCTERNLIGRRTESARTADGNHHKSPTIKNVGGYGILAVAIVNWN